MVDCEVVVMAEDAVKAGKKFTLALRKLRRALDACDQCAKLDQCTFRQEFNNMVDAAVLEVNAEWDMRRE